MQNSHEEMKEFVAAYVLGALPEDEEFLARTHILSCDECIAEAEAQQEVVASLSLAADEAVSPPDLADRIVAAATVSDLSGTAGHVAGAAGHVERRPRVTLSLRAAAAVAAVLLVVGGMSVAMIQLNERLQRDERILTALLHSDGGMRLRGEGAAVARILPTQSGAFLVATGLEEVPRNHVYQVWLMRDGTPVSAGLFDAADAISVIELDVRLEDYEDAAITIEPEGGSPSPTTQPILATLG